MAGGIRGLLLPEQQRRTLDELTVDLDLREGDARSKQSAFWTMLVLSAVIASAGILTDSTATVIGAMIIAPLSTPIMGIALAIAKRERNGSLWFVAAGVVVCVGLLFSQAPLCHRTTPSLPRPLRLAGSPMLSLRRRSTRCSLTRKPPAPRSTVSTDCSTR